MTVQKTRPIDTMQRFLVAIKHFEEKLDKLQNDVDSQGETLSDLRAMVTNLSCANIINADMNAEVIKRIQRKSTAVQYDISHTKTRKKTVPSLPSKLRAHSYPSEKGKSPLTSPIHDEINNLEPSEIHMHKHKKPKLINRKANAITIQKRMRY